MARGGNRSGSLQNKFEVELPIGGSLQLQTPEEVQMWNHAMSKYKSDYALTKTNDLVLLGAILTQNLAMFRAQQTMNGMEPELDAQQIPTGRYKKVPVKTAEAAAAQKIVLNAAGEIREIEKALGIDKKTRDAGGGDSIAGYLGALKVAGRQLGVHVVKRTKAYEEFAMELRWRLRVLANGDQEDKAHHNISEASICEFATNRLTELEQIDKEFAKDKGKVFAGKL